MVKVISTHTATVTLPTDDQILITREFDAPARLVWRAVTEPDLVRQWWGAERGEVTLCEIDLRVGGQWRYVMTAASHDMEVGFHGEFYEIVEGERIVQTEVFAGFPDAHSVNTMTLVEADGRTTLTTLVQHQAPEHRDMHINSGMEAGMQESFDALERVAVSLR
jgi:uncharacterized protein YndB with AHSA1/START domain